jgi:hypothetical protein
MYPSQLHNVSAKRVEKEESLQVSKIKAELISFFLVQIVLINRR